MPHRTLERAGTASSGWDTAARVLTGLAVLVTVAMPFAGLTGNVVIFAAVPLAVILAGRRYGWKAAGIYLVVAFVVANVFENLSIATGFPFGTYHYPGTSPRIGDFPVQVAVAYCAIGMISWLVASTLLDNADRRLADRDDPARRITVVTLPALAAAVMTMFDVGTDSAASTIQHAWVWDNGGGVFGVPWTNYLGWWFVTYIFFQIFALVLFRGGATTRAADDTRREPLAQAVTVYFLLAAVTMIQFFTQENEVVVDAAGQTWNTGDLYASLFTFNLFGPAVIVLLAATKLARNDLAAGAVRIQDNSGARRNRPAVAAGVSGAEKKGPWA
ncbi:carotenoid biosynthesis protein [Symbioplanes lichenis]|uniref:carotenoid biosynthesis protein n=1 Tax=Symbioplanes lichenis TaxID=1629072 RepID=UPI00273824E8|nr:carotenoid biosynthesis protein [Actinoplanes lichenis]